YKTLPELIREYIDASNDYRAVAALAATATQELKAARQHAASAEQAVANLEMLQEQRSAKAAEVQKNLQTKRAELRTQLKSLADPFKAYGNQLPLFPRIYRLEVSFPSSADLEPITWDSELPRQQRQYDRLPQPIEIPGGDAAVINIDYQMHVYNELQTTARQER